MKSVVSIIIPHYNRAALLDETIRSLEAQTYSDWEAVVVDDQSDPDEWKQLQTGINDRRIQVLQRESEPKGPSACRNIGLDVAQGKYAIFLDSDDLLAPWCLAERVKIIESHPDIGFAVFPALLFNQKPGDQTILWNDLEKSEPFLNRFLRSDPPWCVASPIWRTERIKALNGFNDRLFYGDDSNLHVRALLDGLQFHIQMDSLPDVFVRRSENRRITSTLSESLLESRLTRLEEGTRLLRRRGATPAQIRIWEGQYFFEIEFLLFNVSRSSERIGIVRQAWRTGFRPPFWRSSLVRWYVAIVSTTRERAYLVVRLARRVMRLALPEEFFPVPGGFESTLLGRLQHQQLKDRLHDRATTI